MTRSKRAFAEMLVAAQGSGDVDDICERMSTLDIIYELKKTEKSAPEPEPVPEPVVKPPVVRPRFPNFWSRLACDDEEFLDHQ